MGMEERCQLFGTGTEICQQISLALLLEGLEVKRGLVVAILMRNSAAREIWIQAYSFSVRQWGNICLENILDFFSVLDIRLCFIKLLLCPLMQEARIQYYLRAQPVADLRHCRFLKHSLSHLYFCKFVKPLCCFKREFHCSHQLLGTGAVCVTIAVAQGT